MQTSPAPPPASGAKAKIPNLLTAGRVVLAIAFFAILAPWDLRRSQIDQAKPDLVLLLAAGMFIVAAITDALDGHLARKWNVVSAFGRIMDPFADKVLVLGAFVLLAGPGFATEMFVRPQGVAASLGTTQSGDLVRWTLSGVQPWMVVLILARELLVTSIRGAVESAGGSFGASWSGKAKMILQCVCVPLVLVLINLQACDVGGLRDLYEGAIHVVVWLTVLVTAWSGLPYITRGIAALRAATPVSPTGGA